VADLGDMTMAEQLSTMTQQQMAAAKPVEQTK
jgi:hypothetical protein